MVTASVSDLQRVDSRSENSGRTIFVVIPNKLSDGAAVIEVKNWPFIA